MGSTLYKDQNGLSTESLARGTGVSQKADFVPYPSKREGEQGIRGEYTPLLTGLIRIEPDSSFRGLGCFVSLRER